jgi:hypothetical protein
VIAIDPASKAPAAARESRPGALRRVALALAGADLRLVAVALAASAAVAAALGIYHLETARVDPGASTDFFDLDGEDTFITVLTSLALLAAAVAAVAAAHLAAGRGRLRLFLHALAGFFTFMALDEGLSFHERFEAAAGIDWQELYVPVFLIGAAAGVGLLLALRGLRAAQLTFLAGGAAWAVAQILEEIQWGSDDRPIGHYEALVVPEELLEYVGSALWFVALVLVIRHLLGPDVAPDAASRAD